jgi:hypothetical protein
MCDCLQTYSLRKGVNKCHLKTWLTLLPSHLFVFYIQLFITNTIHAHNEILFWQWITCSQDTIYLFGFYIQFLTNTFQAHSQILFWQWITCSQDTYSSVGEYLLIFLSDPTQPTHAHTAPVQQRINAWHIADTQHYEILFRQWITFSQTHSSEYLSTNTCSRSTSSAKNHCLTPDSSSI